MTWLATLTLVALATISACIVIGTLRYAFGDEGTPRNMRCPELLSFDCTDVPWNSFREQVREKIEDPKAKEIIAFADYVEAEDTNEINKVQCGIAIGFARKGNKKALFRQESYIKTKIFVNEASAQKIKTAILTCAKVVADVTGDAGAIQEIVVDERVECLIA